MRRVQRQAARGSCTHIMRSQYLESSPLQQSYKYNLYIDVALASSCNKIPVESFVKETVSAGSFASMGKAIVDYADSRRTTLLVMGSRGMGAWTSSLASIIGLGSVSDYVTHHARTPRLLVLPRHLPPYTATLHRYTPTSSHDTPTCHNTTTPLTSPPSRLPSRSHRLGAVGFRPGRRDAQRAVELLRCTERGHGCSLQVKTPVDHSSPVATAPVPIPS
jgi:hypothetical protein